MHLEFVFWTTWQMREQTWHNCQAADGLAKARSRVSPGTPRDPNFSSRHICSIDRNRNPSALHAPPSVAGRSREGLHHKHRPSTRRHPLPIVADSIAQKLPSHAPPSTTDRAETPSTCRRQLPIATNSIAQKLPPRTATHCRTREGLHCDRKPPPHAMSSRTRVPGRAKKLTAREGTTTTRHKEKNLHQGPL